MFMESDKPTISLVYPFPSTKSNIITALVFDYTGFIKTLSMDVLDIKILHPPSKTVIINPCSWALATFPEYPFCKIPVSPIVAENEVKEIVDVLTHIQRFWSQPDGELTPTVRLSVKDPVIARSIVFQATTNDKRTILAISSSGNYVTLTSDFFPDHVFPENTLYICKLTEPSYYRRCVKVSEDEFVGLSKRCLSTRALKQFLYTISPVAPITKRFVERIPAKSAMSLITFGAQLVGKDVTQDEIADNLKLTNDGYLAELPIFRPTESFQIRGGPITKLLISSMNLSMDKKVPMESFLRLIYDKLKIRMSEEALSVLIKEIPGFIVHQGNIIVYYV